MNEDLVVSFDGINPMLINTSSPCTVIDLDFKIFTTAVEGKSKALTGPTGLFSNPSFAIESYEVDFSKTTTTVAPTVPATASAFSAGPAFDFKYYNEPALNSNYAASAFGFNYYNEPALNSNYGEHAKMSNLVKSGDSHGTVGVTGGSGSDFSWLNKYAQQLSQQIADMTDKSYIGQLTELAEQSRISTLADMQVLHALGLTEEELNNSSDPEDEDDEDEDFDYGDDDDDYEEDEDSEQIAALARSDYYEELKLDLAELYDVEIVEQDGDLCEHTTINWDNVDNLILSIPMDAAERAEMSPIYEFAIALYKAREVGYREGGQHDNDE